MFASRKWARISENAFVPLGVASRVGFASRRGGEGGAIVRAPLARRTSRLVAHRRNRSVHLVDGVPSLALAPTRHFQLEMEILLNFRVRDINSVIDVSVRGVTRASTRWRGERVEPPAAAAATKSLGILFIRVRLIACARGRRRRARVARWGRRPAGRVRLDPSRLRRRRPQGAATPRRRRRRPAARVRLGGVQRRLHPRRQIDAHDDGRHLRDGRQRLRTGRANRRSRARAPPGAPVSALLASTLSTDAPGRWRATSRGCALLGRVGRNARAPVRPSSRSPARIAPDFSAFAAASRLAERALRSRAPLARVARARHAMGRRGVFVQRHRGIRGAGRRRREPATARPHRAAARACPRSPRSRPSRRSALRGGDAFECVVSPPRAVGVPLRARTSR